MITRGILPLLRNALADTPVVLVHGPRQAGKTTLVQSSPVASIPSQSRTSESRTYLTLDDAAVLGAATLDPDGFLAAYPGALTIDEVQRAPDLFRAIKARVDRDRVPGRYLLTGSANVLVVPRLSESLAGRVEILTLHALSQAELHAGDDAPTGRETFADRLFGGAPLLAPLPEMRLADVMREALQGGFPEARARSAQRRSAWFGSYLTTILQRDVREIAAIEGLGELPRLLRLVGTQSGGLLNVADLARGLTLSYASVKRYLALLEATFLVYPLPAWSSNRGKRLTKSPKLLVGDSGLLGYLLGLAGETLAPGHVAQGALAETFVGLELLRQQAFSQTPYALYHYRTSDGYEVDFVLEHPDGRMAAVEVKTAAGVGKRDLRGLSQLRETVGERLVASIVLYTGLNPVPFGESLFALPYTALWQEAL